MGLSVLITACGREEASYLVGTLERDRIELKVESDELVAAVQANEVPVEYIVFDDEGHGFRKRENRIAASDAYVWFLNQHLKGAPAASDSTE